MVLDGLERDESWNRGGPIPQRAAVLACVEDPPEGLAEFRGLVGPQLTNLLFEMPVPQRDLFR